MTLREIIERLADGWDNIPIRAKIDDKWGSYFLPELDDKTVGDWIIGVIQSSTQTANKKVEKLSRGERR